MKDDDRIAVLNLIEDYATAKVNAVKARMAGDLEAYNRFVADESLLRLREINYRLGGEKPE